MAELRISEQDFKRLKSHVLSGGQCEEAALLMAGVFYNNGHPVFTVREIIPVADKDFQIKAGVFLQVDPEYLAWVIKRCRNEKLAFILAHNHPFSEDFVGFSGIDDGGENTLVPKLKQRIPGMPHAFLVFGKNAIAGRYWPSKDNTSYPIQKVKIVGERIRVIVTSNSATKKEQDVKSSVYHRQILAIGEQTQKALRALQIAIIGAGGIGSQVFVQLAHLGVGRITIVDDDILEESNRSRVIGSRPEDVNVKDKVSIMRRYAKEYCPEVNVRAIKGNVEFASTARPLLDSDVIFCCTDNVRSRVVLNRLSYQFLIPVIDTGVHLQLDEGGKRLINGVGRVMLIHPDGPCLECTQIITDTALQRETGNETRGAYVTGGPTVREPQVISINGVVASIAVTRLLDFVGDLQYKKPRGRYDAYRPLHGDFKLLPMQREVECNLCSEVRGFADGIALPCKIKETERG